MRILVSYHNNNFRNRSGPKKEVGYMGYERRRVPRPPRSENISLQVRPGRQVTIPVTLRAPLENYFLGGLWQTLKDDPYFRKV